MAVFKLEPFMMLDEKTQEVTGVTVEYWKNFLALEMGIDLEVIGVLPILRATYMLKKGDVDVVSQLTKIPEREADFLYPETPLTSIQSCILVRLDSPLRAVDNQENLFGMTIGFIMGGYIPAMVKHQKIKLDLVSTTDFREMNYQKLMRNRVDALLDINVVSQIYWMKKKGYLNHVRIMMLPEDPVMVYGIFRKTPEGQILRDAYDKANTKGIQQKVFEKISKKFLLQ